MQTSEAINELVTALAKAQGVMGGALKDTANTFFKSKYADLESVWSACRKALSDNGLSVIQSTSGVEGGVVVTTMLAHSSGQWMRDSLPLFPKDTSPQAMGSAITYGRRYALAAMVGVYQTDDDAEAAHGRAQPQRPHPNPVEAAAPDSEALAKKFREALEGGIDGRVYQVHLEANGNQELYAEAAGLLTPKQRNDIKGAIERVKRPNTNRAQASA